MAKIFSYNARAALSRAGAAVTAFAAPGWSWGEADELMVEDIYDEESESLEQVHGVQGDWSRATW